MSKTTKKLTELLETAEEHLEEVRDAVKRAITEAVDNDTRPHSLTVLDVDLSIASGQLATILLELGGNS